MEALEKAEDALLARLISEGLTPAEIAEKYRDVPRLRYTTGSIKSRSFWTLIEPFLMKGGWVTYTKEEIRSIADDNRIWVGLIAAVRVSAICSFSTLVLLVLAIFFL